MAKGDISDGLGESCCSRTSLPLTTDTYRGLRAYQWNMSFMEERRRREEAEARIERLIEERQEVMALALGVGEGGAFDG